MALELVGGALASAFFQVIFDKLASADIRDYFRGRKLNQKLLEKLRIMLLPINAVLDDAEEKQFRDVNVKGWLDEVKDAAFDAEDLLDEIHIQLSKCKREAAKSRSKGSLAINKVRHIFHASRSSFDKKIEPRMQDILDKLEYLAAQKDILLLGLKEGSGGHVSRKPPPSTSLLSESEPVLYGRGVDKQIVFNWLMHDTENDNRQLSIISIVGMGGMGKTTLVQHLYNDTRMVDKFEIRAWVCVSDESGVDLCEVTRAILEEITESTDESRELNKLQVKLKEKLMGKRFLLVLDDIWNIDSEKWESLRAPFNGAAQGSTILVTTRNGKVATDMRSNNECQLEQLQEEHCWQLFSKYAFHDENSQSNPDFEEVGKKIVNKCKGLPLALKTIGRLLYTKSSLLEWEMISRSDVWEISYANSKLVPALMLSYQDLPSHLKRCFAYCSLFPKDYEFEKEELVLLWMTQSYLKCTQQGKNLKQVGKECFDVLLSRCFFQLSSRDQSRFVMHDLLNDLAKYVSGNFFWRMEDEEAQNISKMTRHFSFLRSENEPSKRFDSLDNANKLRTFLPLSRNNAYLYIWDTHWISDTSVHELVSKFKFLRALSFSGYEMKELPDSIHNLTHLRYLDLSCTHIKKLPDSICLLYNLEILKLKGCRNLEELPSNLHKLTNLLYLDFSRTQVREIPVHLGKLNNLQVLSSFYVGKSKECNIEQIGELNLHGALSISELQNIVNPIDAVAAKMKNKIHLVKLELEWSAKNDDDSQKEREVLEKLQPSKHLKELSIRNYGGKGFPNWFGDNSLSNVVSLTLENCKKCESFPSFGLLPSLKHLSIIGLHGVVVIGSEFYGNDASSSSTVPFASLETLVFEDMYEWEEWECKTVGGVFPRLQELSLKKCPKLKEHFPEKLPSLKKLTVRNCQELVASVPWAPDIQELNLYDCGKVQFGYHLSTLQTLGIGGDGMEESFLERIGHTISSCTSLVNLTIRDSPNMNIFSIRNCYNFLVKLYITNSSCESLKTFPLDFFPRLRSLELWKCRHLEMITQQEEEEPCHNNLTHLTIWDCPEFVSFPKGGLSAPRLEWFKLTGLSNLRSLPECMHNLLPSLQMLSIVDCPQLESFSDGGLPPKLEDLTLGGKCCKLLMASLKHALATNTCSMLHLSIEAMNDVESFPDEGLLPHSLTSLEIDGCLNLKKLDYRGLCHLPSLTKLQLFNCPKLQRLPEEGLPKSISTLRIRKCPLLKQRCHKPNGEDWGKISHIQLIFIDYELIT